MTNHEYVIYVKPKQGIYNGKMLGMSNYVDKDSFMLVSSAYRFKTMRECYDCFDKELSEYYNWRKDINIYEIID